MGAPQHVSLRLDVSLQLDDGPDAACLHPWECCYLHISGCTMPARRVDAIPRTRSSNTWCCRRSTSARSLRVVVRGVRVLCVFVVVSWVPITTGCRSSVCLLGKNKHRTRSALKPGI
jgi:hypothetical protein